ncbi:MAG: hypothetical protein ABSG29_10425 [Steroidobacteraceae bacterium]|jgi:glycine/D-amino acid oxidase-like deaminating enzyme
MPTALELDAPRCLYPATAVAPAPAPELSDDARAEILIVGGVTPDFYPRFHHPQPGLYILLGYSGRGLALSSAMGAELASVLAGAPVEGFPLPVSPVRRMPLHRFWRLGVNARVAYGRLLDRLGR